MSKRFMRALYAAGVLVSLGSGVSAMASTPAAATEAAQRTCWTCGCYSWGECGCWVVVCNDAPVLN
jgi:hypothetical protein